MTPSRSNIDIFSFKNGSLNRFDLDEKGTVVDCCGGAMKKGF